MESITIASVLEILSQFGMLGVLVFIWWYDQKTIAKTIAKYQEYIAEVMAKHQEDLQKVLDKYRDDMAEIRRMYENNVSLVRELRTVIHGQPGSNHHEHAGND